jgi:BioD-like phosphotransacetylase family protein
MTSILITAPTAQSGKTTLALALAHNIANNSNKSVEVFIPSSESHTSITSNLETTFQNINVHISIYPIENNITDTIPQMIKDLETNPDINIIESGEELSSDSISKLNTVLNTQVLAITDYPQATDTQKIKEWIDTLESSFSGLIINKLPQYRKTTLNNDILPSLESNNISVLGIIPENRNLISISIDDISQLLGGELIANGAPTNSLIEYFLVGTFGMDNGIEYFKTRNKAAVIIRADRPDVHMTALHVGVSCLILTNDVNPIEYVLNEAQELETPLILVKSGTEETMDKLEVISQYSSFNHKEKLMTFSSMMESSVDLSNILEFNN